ncbi:MAG: hypothetical protein HQL31_14025, partial [Planctomycetes bacterium]|nr:hypothetical protein [Planctomycetota bacterium]
LHARPDGRLGGQVSWKVPALPGVYEGGYVNGAVVLKAGFDQGVLSLHLDSFEVNSKPLPASLMAYLRANNLAAKINSRPEVQSLLQRIEKIEIQGDQVLIKARDPK